MFGVGEPVDVIINVPDVPARKVVLFALVICGATESCAKPANADANRMNRKIGT
jgi:hypothetical protein